MATADLERRGDIGERLRTGCVLCDGAMGTMLAAGGASGWTIPEELNLLDPDRVGRVHQAYAAAGSQVVVSNTFGGSPRKLAMLGLEARTEEINLAAARIAREAVGQGIWVAGSIGPTGALMEPYGGLSPEEAEEGFRRQAESLLAGGADAIIVETMISADEARAGIRAARGTGLPIIATMAFEPHGRTVMGDRLEDVLSLLDEGALVVGLNCGQGPDTMEPLIARLRALAPTARLAAQPNAGIPQVSEGVAAFEVTPERMARFARSLSPLGLALVGCCCGSGPDHIRAMAAALREA